MDGCLRIFDLYMGRDSLALMYYAPLALIGLSTSQRPGYSQVHQGTVQPICHQLSFVLALGKNASDHDSIKMGTRRIGIGSATLCQVFLQLLVLSLIPKGHLCFSWASLVYELPRP